MVSPNPKASTLCRGRVLRCFEPPSMLVLCQLVLWSLKKVGNLNIRKDTNGILTLAVQTLLLNPVPPLAAHVTGIYSTRPAGSHPLPRQVPSGYPYPEGFPAPGVRTCVNFSSLLTTGTHRDRGFGGGVQREAGRHLGRWRECVEPGE